MLAVQGSQQGSAKEDFVSINYIPNDPMAGASAPPTRRKSPRANRPSSRATFQFFDAEPEGLASPGTPQFLFWQAREAALTTLTAWETANGSSFLRRAGLSSSARRDLVERMGAGRGARLAVHPLDIGEERVAHATVTRDVSVGALHPSLKGVVVPVTNSVLIGASGGRAAVLGSVPNVDTTTDEVLSFVESLVKNRRIETKPPKHVPKRHRVEAMTPYTHEIIRIGRRRELRRRAFACGCCFGN